MMLQTTTAAIEAEAAERADPSPPVPRTLADVVAGWTDDPAFLLLCGDMGRQELRCVEDTLLTLERRIRALPNKEG